MDILLFISILLAVSFHEIGHAMAMRKYGVKINHISLFGFDPKLIKWHSKYFDCTMGFSLLPIGAYVSHVEYSKHQSEYQREIISMAGVKNNFYMALFAYILHCFVKEGNVNILGACAVSLLLISLTIHRVQRFLILYLLPILMILLIYWTLKDNSFISSYEKGFVTDINFVKDVKLNNFWKDLFIVNMVLGLLNMLPIIGLDGWQVFKNGYINKVKETFLFKAFTYFALAWLLLLSIAPLIGDVKNIFFWAVKLFN